MEHTGTPLSAYCWGFGGGDGGCCNGWWLKKVCIGFSGDVSSV